MNVLNLTPHKIVVYDGEGDKILKEYEPHGFVVRLKSATQKVCHSASLTYSVPICDPQRFIDIILPPDEKVLQSADAIIVSAPVGQYFMDEFQTSEFCPSYDVLGPDTGPQSVLRDDKGNIKGVTRLNLYVKAPNGRKRSVQ